MFWCICVKLNLLWNIFYCNIVLGYPTPLLIILVLSQNQEGFTNLSPYLQLTT